MNYGTAPTYVKIASRTLSSTTSTVTFSNIPQGYTDLVIVGSNILSNRAGGQDLITITFNSDTGANYSATNVDGSSGGATSVRWTGLNAAILGFMSDNNTTANASLYPSDFTINIQNYSNASMFKSMLCRYNFVPSTISYSRVGANVGLWRSLTPITNLSLSTYYASYLSGCTFTLYGIKAALAPKATGGDIIATDGQYWYHAFRSTGAFIPQQSLTADFLMVAGGGSGGTGFSGGGGGAGGHIYTSGASLTANTIYTATVGAGGSANGYSTNPGANSTFNSVTAYAGGNGGGSFQSTAPAGTWGSGGGVASLNSTGTGAAGTTGQGNRGGNNTSAQYQNPYGACGGGGAGATGGDVSSGCPSTAGGVGLSTYSSWGLLTGTGHNSSGTVFFAGGGGGGAGGASGGTAGGAGGTGGGGTGGFGESGTNYPVGNATSGLPATGGGGGGAGHYANAGSGGSGVVIVRYSI